MNSSFQTLNLKSVIVDLTMLNKMFFEEMKENNLFFFSDEPIMSFFLNKKRTKKHL